MTDQTPAPRLGDAIRRISDPFMSAAEVEALADRADALERERDEARAQVERVTALADRLESSAQVLATKALLLRRQATADLIRAALTDPEHWTTTALALRLARVRALVLPLAEGGPTDDEPLTVGDVRAALADPKARS